MPLNRLSIYVSVCATVVVGVVLSAVAANQSNDVPRIHCSWDGIKTFDLLIHEFMSRKGGYPLKDMPQDNNAIPRSLMKHDCDIGVILDSFAPDAAKTLGKDYEVIPLADYVANVAASARNPTHALTVEELRGIYRGQIRQWKELSDTAASGSIELYCPLWTNPECHLFLRKVLNGQPFARELFDRSQKPRHERISSTDVMACVIKQPNAIGFFLLGDEKNLDKRIRILRIAKDKDSTPVLPTAKSISDGSYPLVDTLTLYLHPDAPPSAREFCKFATGPEGAKIIKQFGLWPEYELEKERGKQRLVDVKAGKGTGIVVCDLTGCEDVLKDMASGFVRAKAAVQLKFQKGETRDTAIEKLAKGATELLLADKDSGQWSAASGQKTANPKSIELGRMAVGIIVHPENPLESLPLDEAKSIFCGEIKKWPAVRGAAAAMHVFGLKHTNPTTQLLKEKLVERGRSLKYSTQPDNEKVILAVARNPAAIGFVDLSQLPPNDKSVKLVPVCEGTGKGKAPTSNPLSRTLTLYVSPNASQTAKDFADFLTPEHCKGTIAQYNLLPPLHAENASQLASRPHPGPLPKGPQIDLASADEPIPLLLDDPDAPQDQAKPKKLAAKPKPVIPAPEQPAPPKVTTDAQPAPETESEPQPTQTHPGAPSLTDEQIVWLVGGIAGVVLLALGVGWLQAPHRKRKRR